MSSTPGSSARGLQHNLFLVSTTHGQLQLPTLSSFSLDPATKEDVVAEMGTPFGVLNVQFFEKFSGQLDYTTTDDDTIPALFMDTQPTSGQSAVYVPHLTYQAPFTLYGNQTHMVSGKIFQGFVAAQCLGVLTKKQAAGGNEMVTIKFTGTQLYVVGANNANTGTGAIDYNRGVNTPAYATPIDKTFSAGAITLNKTPAPWPLPGAGNGTQTPLVIIKNGKLRNIATDIAASAPWTLSGSTFTVSPNPASGDIWETFTAYQP